MADDVDLALSSSSSSFVARRVKYGRQDYHLFVERRKPKATLTRCSHLFDVAPSRVKFFAGGRALSTEDEIEAAAAGGSPILCVGTRRADIVRTESAPRRAMIRIERVVATALWLWRATLKPACRFVAAWLRLDVVVRSASPWLSHAAWCGDVFVRSIDPSWKNPYRENFDRRRRAREAEAEAEARDCLLYTSPSPRDATLSRMPSSA